MKKIVLITGAAGFIGSRLAHKLWKEGFDVVCVDNLSYGHKSNLQFKDKQFILIEGDIRDTEMLTEVFKQNCIFAVCNIAGIAPLPDCQSRPVEALETNVEGFVNLLEMSREFKVEKIIQASTNAIYENEKQFPVSEKSFSTVPTLIYPVTKYCAERFAQSYAECYGMNISCLRFANVYGPGMDMYRKQPSFVSYVIRELLGGRRPVLHSTGTQKRDYIYVDDLTELIFRCLVSESRYGFETLNCSSGMNYSVSEIYNQVKNSLGSNLEPVFTEAENYWKGYSNIQDLKKEVLMREVNKETLCDSSLAFERYGWKPQTTLKEGVENILRDFIPVP